MIAEARCGRARCAVRGGETTGGGRCLEPCLLGDDVHWMGSSPKFVALTSKILVGKHTTTHRAEKTSSQRSGVDLGYGQGEESFDHQDLRIIGQPLETIRPVDL